MADMRGVTASRTVNRSGGDDAYHAVRMWRDGSMSIVDLATVMAVEGYCYTANIGTLTTPIAGHVGIDDDQPEAVVDVPTGKTIIPVYISVYLEDSAGTDNEIVYATSRANVGAGTSTAGTALNMATDNPNNSSCSVYRSYTGNGVATSSKVEFYRGGYPFADATTDPQKRFEWSLKTHANSPVIVGLSALVLYWAATTTAPSGFATITWMEFATEWLKG